MIRKLLFSASLIAFAGVQMASAQSDCENFKMYYVNIPAGGPSEGSSILYEGEIDATGTAVMLTELTSFVGGAHIALTTDGTLYVVGVNGVLYDFDTATNTPSAGEQITVDGEALTNVPHAVADPSDGTLYVASANTDAVYSVDPVTAEATLVQALDVDVRGGDLVITNDGILWLVNRFDNTFYNISAGGVPGFSVDLNNINGAGVLADGTIIVANAGSTVFNLIDPMTAELLPNVLETEITFGNGDIAAACVGGDDIIIPGTECYAADVLLYEPGEGNIPEDRMDPTKALGEPDRGDNLNFVALGFGGTLILSMDGEAKALPGVDDLEIVETTFGNNDCESYEERADIYVSQQVVEDASEIDDTQFVYVGESCTNGEFFDVFEATGFTYFTLVKIVDVTPEEAQFPDRDGYDVDGLVALNGCDDLTFQTPGECFAAEVIEYVEGVQDNGSPLFANRTDPSKALGEPARTDENVFVTLGYGGSITLAFDGIVPNLAGDDLEVVETSFGNPGCESYPEYADVYVSQDGVDFHFARTVCKSDPFVDISAAGPFPYITYVKIVNNDELSTTFDAFDLDGVVAIHNCDEDQLTFDAPLTAATGGVILETFPNPSVGQVNVEFVSDKNNLITVEVIDMNGRIVETLFRQNANAGQEYRLSFEGSNLPNGVYITKLTTESEVVINKVLIAR